MLTPKESVAQLRRMGSEAYRAGLHRKAARLYGKARKLTEEAGDERQRVKSLRWEARCLKDAGEVEDATPSLLEAANCRSPEADPADVFGAAADLIEISLDHKSASYCRTLIAEAREYLAGIAKEQWQHMLDRLEGDLEYRRGDAEQAHRLYVRARDGLDRAGRGSYPAYTWGTCLHDLCNAAFRLGRAELDRWVQEIESCNHRHEVDKVYAKHGRLLLLRADRCDGGDFSPAPDIALGALSTVSLFEGQPSDDIRDSIACLRALALAGRWTEIEDYLAKLPLKEDFGLRLLRGDERLCRARQALGMEVRDDEYDVEFPPPGPDMPDPETGLTYLREAEAFFESARDEAEREDERLETKWYTETLDGRLARTRAIKEAVLAATGQEP